MKIPMISRKRPDPKPRSSQEEAAYHRGMAKLVYDRGYVNLATSHVIAAMEAEGM